MEPKSIRMVKDFVESGYYGAYKQTEAIIKATKEEMKRQLRDSEVSRHEFKKRNVVAKWVKNPTYETDHRGLVEYMLDYLSPEYTCKAIKLDHKALQEDKEVAELIKKHELPTSYYAKVFFNKEGKVFYQHDKETLNLEGMSLDSLALIFNRHESSFNFYRQKFSELREGVVKCEDLQRAKLEQNQGLKYELGSVSLIPNNPVYNVLNVYEMLGEDFLLSYGRVDSKKLQWYLDTGVLQENGIKEFKTEINRDIKFVMMPLDRENEMVSNYHQRKIEMSMKRFG